MKKNEKPKKPRGRPRKKTFEDHQDFIFEKINLRKKSWFLNSVSWISWEDVCQIIAQHIYTKWHLWDQKRPLTPWVNRIITNQIKNLLRNYYGNFLRPCSQCPFNNTGSIDYLNEKENGCSWTKSGRQDCTCPLFKKWNNTKKHSFNINTAGSIENLSQEQPYRDNNFNIDYSTEKLHSYMESHLSPKQYIIYRMLYIEHKSPQETAKALGYKSSEKGRHAGYKQIKNFEKIFKEQAKKIIQKYDII